MKSLGTLFASLTHERQMRRNLAALARLFALLGLVVGLFTIGFHVIMAWEGQEYSWFTGVYWSLTVMSTLGFGDITFTTDVGRAFSMLVLIVGMILLLIVLPFAFISYFYAPWLEARLRQRAPRTLPATTRDHLVLTAWDPIAQGLAQRLEARGLPYVVLEPDPARAAELHADGISVVTGALDDRTTYERVRADEARLVVANRDDVTNTSITLTVREVTTVTPVAAVATLLDSMDVLQLAGADHVLPLKQRLGVQLATRADAGHGEAHVIGRFNDILIAEFSALGTQFAGRTVQDISSEELCGSTIVACWERAHLHRASPTTAISAHGVPVVAGTARMIDALNETLRHTKRSSNPVVVIGSGKVGRAATRALKARGVRVNVVDKKPELEAKLRGLPDRFIVGDASSLEVIEDAGIADAPTVLLTTNDDAQNVFLAVYCRRLRPDILILCRITHPRNVESIHRAGADLALTYADLGVQSILSLALGRDSVILGEGIELLDLAVPARLVGQPVSACGLNHDGPTLVAVHGPDGTVVRPPDDTVLAAGCEITVLGDQREIDAFMTRRGSAAPAPSPS